VRQINSDLVFLSARKRQISGQSYYSTFKIVCKKAGLDDLHPHDLRHTFATRLIKNGVSIYNVSKLLGHASVTTSERYAHLETGDLKEDVKKIGTSD